MLWIHDEGQGQHLVLLHPVGTSGDIWWQHIPRLAKRFRVLAVDLSGHGRSPKPKEPLSIEGMADAVYDTLAKQSLLPAHFVGLSVGGMVAQMLVVKYPLSINTLILCNTLCKVDSATAKILEERAIEVEQGGMEAIVAPTLERWFAPGFIDEHSEVVTVVKELLLKADPTINAQTWRAIAKFDAASRIGSVSHIPTLVVNGSMDASVPPDSEKTLCGCFNAKLVELSGCAHMAPVEAPEKFMDHLESFLLGRESG